MGWRVFITRSLTNAVSHSTRSRALSKYTPCRIRFRGLLVLLGRLARFVERSHRKLNRLLTSYYVLMTHKCEFQNILHIEISFRIMRAI